MRPKTLLKYKQLTVASTRQKVLEILFRYPDKQFSLSDLAKEAGVAKQHIGNTLDELNADEFITIEKLSKLWRVQANQSSWAYQRAKIVYNLNFIYQSGLVEFLDEQFQRPKAIVLFGSFRTGQDTTNSDIDIAIEVVQEKNHEITGLRELIPFEQEIHRKIQLHIFSRKHIDENVFANIANGIVLSGFLEVHK